MNEAAAPPAPRPARRRWMTGLLIASLSLNAVMVGAVIRSIWHMRIAGAIAGPALEARLPGFIGTLPQERREKLRAEGLIDRPRLLRPLRAEVRRARAEVARAFEAQPFDRQAFVTAQTAMLEAETKLRREVQNVLPDIAERLTAEERRSFIRWRGRGPGPGPRGPRPDAADDAEPDQRGGGKRGP